MVLHPIMHGLKAQQHIAPRASEATPWVTNCHSIDALKGQKHSMLNNLFKAFALTGRVFKIYNIFSHGFEGVLTL